MLSLVNPGLFNAHALSADENDSHIRQGNHLRISPHPKLGLPVAPFLIGRSTHSITQLEVGNLMRTTAIFIDSAGDRLQPPFEVTPDNPVTAKIPLKGNEACLWAEVLVKNANPTQLFTRVFNTHFDTTVLVNSIRGRLNLSRNVPFRIDVNRFNINDFDLPTVLKPVPRINHSSIKCEAFMSSLNGMASIGIRSRSNYRFTGPNIAEIKITGRGEVTGIRWIEANELTIKSRGKKALNYFPLYEILNLPHRGGLRYLSVNNAINKSIQQVIRQAPKRTPLQETKNTPTPNTAPVASSNDEKLRVASLYGNMQNDLNALINDATEPNLQVLNEQIFDDKGKVIGTSRISRLNSFNQLQLDPGTAALIGYKLYDDQEVEEDHLVIYNISGFFKKPLLASTTNNNTHKLSYNDYIFKNMLANIHDDHSAMDIKDILAYLRLFERIPNSRTVDISNESFNLFDNSDVYLGIRCLAIADPSSVLDQVRPLKIDETSHQDWLPTEPPDIKRVIKVKLSNGLNAALIAAGKRHIKPSNKYFSLNKENSSHFHLPLLLGMTYGNDTNNALVSPDIGYLNDRQAAPGKVSYYVAQQDRFGRWSPWTTKTASPGPRPLPPQPQLQALYNQPTIENANTRGGNIFIKVAVPDPSSLAPGSYPLKHISINITDLSIANPVSGTTNYTVLETQKVFDSNTKTDNLIINAEGPVLSPTEQRKVRIVANWYDISHRKSIDSVPITLTLTDPRPPPQLPLPDLIQFAAKPDITGISWVEYRWKTQSNALNNKVNYDIYYTDENRLIAHLETLGETALLTSIAQADLAKKATLFKKHNHLFADHLFEKLSEVIIESTSGFNSFRHAVSGSLTLLNFYKIATTSDTGAKPDLSELDMIVFAIPNADPPAIPSLTVTQVDPEPGDSDLVALLKVEVPSSPNPAHKWRIRRSSISTSNLLDIPVVNVEDIAAAISQSEPQIAEYRDSGAVQIAPNYELKPWVSYSWVVEAQGEPQGGNTPNSVPGSWSKASSPCSLVLVPAEAPLEATITSFTSDSTGTGHKNISFTINHAEDLSGGAIGSYTLSLRRRIHSNEPFKLLHVIEVSGTGPFIIDDNADDLDLSEVPFSSEYQVQVTDPLGRVSEVSNTFVVS